MTLPKWFDESFVCSALVMDAPKFKTIEELNAEIIEELTKLWDHHMDHLSDLTLEERREMLDPEYHHSDCDCDRCVDRKIKLAALEEEHIAILKGLEKRQKQEQEHWSNKTDGIIKQGARMHEMEQKLNFAIEEKHQEINKLQEEKRNIRGNALTNGQVGVDAECRLVHSMALHQAIQGLQLVTYELEDLITEVNEGTIAQPRDLHLGDPPSLAILLSTAQQEIDEFRGKTLEQLRFLRGLLI